MAHGHHDLGKRLQDIGQFNEAELEYGAALDIRKKLAADYPTNLHYKENLAVSHNNLANLYSAKGRFKDAEAAYLAALDQAKRLASEGPTAAKYQSDLATIHLNLARIFRATDRPRLAETAQLAAEDIRKKLAWIYNSSAGKQGWFRLIGKTWIETTTDGNHPEFEEVASTGGYVELLDRKRNMRLRLYADHAEWQRDKVWVRLYTGGWVRVADLPKSAASP